MLPAGQLSRAAATREQRKATCATEQLSIGQQLERGLFPAPEGTRALPHAAIRLVQLFVAEATGRSVSEAEALQMLDSRQLYRNTELFATLNHYFGQLQVRLLKGFCMAMQAKAVSLLCKLLDMQAASTRTVDQPAQHSTAAAFYRYCLRPIVAPASTTSVNNVGGTL